MNKKIAVIAVALVMGLVAANTGVAGDDTFCATSKSVRNELLKADAYLRAHGILYNSAHEALKKWDDEVTKPALDKYCPEDDNNYSH
jgi:hypothetical protein